MRLPTIIENRSGAQRDLNSASCLGNSHGVVRCNFFVRTHSLDDAHLLLSQLRRNHGRDALAGALTRTPTEKALGRSVTLDNSAIERSHHDGIRRHRYDRRQLPSGLLICLVGRDVECDTLYAKDAIAHAYARKTE